MKKIIFSLGLLFFVQNQMSAQVAQNFRFGLQTSPMITWLSSDDKKVIKEGSNLAFKLGMMSEYFLDASQRYAIKSGVDLNFNVGGALRYRTLGGNLFPNSSLSQTQLSNLPDDTSMRYRLQTIEIPLSLKMRTGDIAGGGYMRFFAEFPVLSLSFNTKARADIQLSGVDGEGENIYPDSNILNFSWGLGGGLEYAIGQQTSLIGGIFYQQNLLDVTKDNDINDSKITVGSLVIRLGVMF